VVSLPITIKHRNPLLEDISQLAADEPKEYAGFVYLWKCIPETLYYIGSHKGNAYDQYRGSGRRFKQVYDYYGLTKFERVVLEYVAELTELRRREQHWMDKFNAVGSKLFLNEKKALNT
jgi:hypothetical protein